MALSLITEVMDFVAGTDLTPTERLVLVVIAERANAATREAWQQAGRWVLADRVGLSERGLRKVLAGLAERGLDVRIPLSVAEDGRKTYAANGHQTTYRVPRLDGEGGTSVPPKGGTRVPAKGGTLKQKGGTLKQKGGTGVPPFSSYPVSNQQQHAREPRHIVMQNSDAKPSEADAVVARIQNEIKPRSLGGFLAHLARSGDLQTWVGEARAAAIKADLKTTNELRQRLPPCPDGEPGGDQLHPTSGEPWCIDCRKRFRAARLNRTASPPPSAAQVIALRPREVS